MNLNTLITNINKSPVYNIIKKTPLQYANFLSKKTNNNIYLKREDLLPIFSFKLRGAYHKIYNVVNNNVLSTSHKLIACSAGNHAQGVAYSAKELNLDAKIVMPKITPQIKIDSVKNLGAHVIIHGNNFNEAQEFCYDIMKYENRTLIHPYNDYDVIAGQGTIGLELLNQLNDIDRIFCCVGGGGLISGIGAYIKMLKPSIEIIGVETENCNAMTQSLKENKIVELDNICSYADGAAVKKVGDLTFDIAKQVINKMVNVSNNEINYAIIDTFKDTRTILEPAGALGVAGAKKYLQQNNINHSNNVIITSGSNIDFKKLRYISEMTDETEAFLSLTIPEKKGSFNNLYNLIYPNNVTEFSYRMNKNNDAQIYLSFQGENINEVLDKLSINNINFEDVKNNSLVKDHLRYFINSNNNNINERIFRFHFPDHPGALKKFLDNLTDNFNVSLFHYRNHGSDIGKVLVGLQSDDKNIDQFLNNVGYTYFEERL